MSLESFKGNPIHDKLFTFSFTLLKQGSKKPVWYFCPKLSKAAGVGFNCLNLGIQHYFGPTRIFNHQYGAVSHVIGKTHTILAGHMYFRVSTGNQQPHLQFLAIMLEQELHSHYNLPAVMTKRGISHLEKLKSEPLNQQKQRQFKTTVVTAEN